MKTIFALLTFSFLSLGCATKFYVPGNKFLSPESNGGTFKGEAKAGGAGVTQVTVADDTLSTSPDLTPSLAKNSAVALGLQIGAIDRLDFYYNSVSSSPTFAGVKFQFLGDSMPGSKSGSFSGAFAYGLAFGSTKQSMESGGVSAESQIKFSGSEALLLFGYRATDAALLYAGPMKSTLHAKIQINRNSAGVISTTAEPNGKGDMMGAIVGIRFGKSFFLNIEGAFTEMKWTREQPTELETEKFSDTALGVALGGSW